MSVSEIVGALISTLVVGWVVVDRNKLSTKISERPTEKQVLLYKKMLENDIASLKEQTQQWQVGIKQDIKELKEETKKTNDILTDLRIGQNGKKQ